MNENETIILNSDAQIMLNMEYILPAIKLKMNRKKIYEVLKSQHKYTYSYVNFAKRLKKILEEQEEQKQKERTEAVMPNKVKVLTKPANSNKTKGFYAETNPDVNQLV